MGRGLASVQNFNEYLLWATKFTALQQAPELPLAVDTDCERYLEGRLALLEEQLSIVDCLAHANELPDAIPTDSGLKITSLDASVPQSANI